MRPLSRAFVKLNIAIYAGLELPVSRFSPKPTSRQKSAMVVLGLISWGLVVPSEEAPLLMKSMGSYVSWREHGLRSNKESLRSLLNYRNLANTSRLEVGVIN